MDISDNGVLPVCSDSSPKINTPKTALTKTTSGSRRFAQGPGMTVVALLCFVALMFLCVLILHGVAWVIERVIPWVLAAAYLAAFVGFVVLLPLSFFHRTRAFSANGILLVSYVLGIWTWCYAFVVTYNLWGVPGIIIGFLLAGVGIVPIAIIAAMFRGEWWIVFDLLLYAGLTFGSKLYSTYLSVKEDARRAD